MRRRSSYGANTKMDDINVEVWLYGPIASYAGSQSKGCYAQLHLGLPSESTMKDLLERLGVPDEEKGITFINGSLASLPGLDTDHDAILHDGDRVGISHRRSMWPFQYRFGASQTDDLRKAFGERTDGGIHHAYTEVQDQQPRTGVEGDNAMRDE